MQLYFALTETTFAQFEATRTNLERYGKPVAFYSDKASIFRPTGFPECQSARPPAR